MNEIRKLLQKMTSLETYIAPIGPNSFIENLCRSELRHLSFSKGNLINGSFENIETISFDSSCIFSESQFFSTCQISGVRNLRVKVGDPSEYKEANWSNYEKERCNSLMKDLKSLSIQDEYSSVRFENKQRQEGNSDYFMNSAFRFGANIEKIDISGVNISAIVGVQLDS